LNDLFYFGTGNLTDAFLGLGSNLGDREAYLKVSREAVNKLKKTTIIRSSSIYETEPWGIKKQRPFLNQIIEIETELTPLKLFAACQNIEIKLKRRETEKWGPREIDIDLLLYGDSIIDNKKIQIPHPRLSERRFVLIPLSEIAPQLRVPGLGRSVEELLDACPDRGAVKFYGDFHYQS
jgi:2-amino-4-hydroxy-6-hydroxymethyldihydropteridine diphosphokinase